MISDLAALSFCSLAAFSLELHSAGAAAVAMDCAGRDCVDFVLAAGLWIGRASSAEHSQWLDEVDWNWVPSFGIHFHLAVDGLSLLMLMLTFFLGIVAVLASWTEIRERVGFFHFNLLWVLAGIAGVFLAVDLFLFYFAWELMLIPMYFLIVIWGHERRVYAAVSFSCSRNAAAC
jgi:NADH-quinone oxidoreductase subunit M